MKIIDRIIPDSLSKHVRRWRYDLRYKRKFKELHGYELNEDNPNTFAEKIFYRKKFGNFEEMAKFADKYTVRKYVEKQIGAEYLIPILGIYEQLKIADFDDLPNKFVVKTTHGSGKNHIEIVRDKASHDLDKLIEKMNYALTLDFGFVRRELAYTKIEKRIMIESFLPSESDTPDDYKCHCFTNDEIFIGVDQGRFTEHKRSIYDENWNMTDIALNTFPPVEDCKKPVNFELMKQLVRKLAENFDYVRVDFYNINGKMFFGELTLTPANGMESLQAIKQGDNWGEKWGKLWVLDKENKLLYRN
ncbi:ATP-grasp fold amidoligase family protein [Moritella viscosa]|uniref:ATP-grasp fold amidoligase family protein n=1 Tax=Moritella viscosa TaxID=80854 RepID=UPI00090F6F0A|nr:ATP-grasp fold amidoligase family protein [Moritella viscosa]SGY99049.1 Eps11Q [Moritella viscosa]SHO25962.1 Eps11Q [Moritella viscosa]